MASSILSAPKSSSNNLNLFRTNPNDTSKSGPSFNKNNYIVTCRPIHSRQIRTKKSLHVTKVAGMDDFSAAVDPNSPVVTWQIVVGTLAGVTPFVVAGIEFSKRIIAQKKCESCGGSGLILKKEMYVRCRSCGGFLPWQSWKRFFSG